MFSTQKRKLLLKKIVKKFWLIRKSAYLIYEWPLRENYPDLPMCSSCQKIVIRPVECETDRCSGVFHYHCSYKINKKLDKVAKYDKVNCNLCHSELPDRKEVYANVRKNSSSNSTRAGQKRKRMESDSESE